MTGAPTNDQPRFVAGEPEHCYDCKRLVRPGQTCFVIMDPAVVCADCIRAADAFGQDRPFGFAQDRPHAASGSKDRACLLGRKSG